MLVMLAQFCAILLFLWTPVSARILALVLQLYERNKLKLNYKRELYATLLLCSFQPHRHIKAIPVVTHTGNKSVPIQLAQCWFPGQVIYNAKI